MCWIAYIEHANVRLGGWAVAGIYADMRVCDGYADM